LGITGAELASSMAALQHCALIRAQLRVAVLSKGDAIADEPKEFATWLPVIGKALAYLCLAKAIEGDAEKYKSILDKTKFLEGLGLPEEDAAFASGSTAESVRVAKYDKSKAKNGAPKKSKARRQR
jgi:hypothetical protein